MPTAHIIGPIAARLMGPWRAGQEVDWHEHRFAHTTFLVSGAARIHCRMGDQDLVAEVTQEMPVLMRFRVINAGVRHRIVSLREGSTFACLYPHRDAEEPHVVVEHYNGWDPAHG